MKLAVCIPAYNESGLLKCLDSLFISYQYASSTGTDLEARVLILINAPASAPAEVLELNQRCLEEGQAWIREHQHKEISFQISLDHSFEPKKAGVGTARKILMDQAARELTEQGHPDGLIISLDADTLVSENYLVELAGLDPRYEGCSIRFEHPLSPGDRQLVTTDEKFTKAHYDAIAHYELHLHYYLGMLRYTGHPHAFHTVGSAFAVRATVYSMEGGMNRKQGGEDFYFIQKIARRGKWSELNTCCVYPSPRPSLRVPFGTGPEVARLSSSGEELLSYSPLAFQQLKGFFAMLPEIYQSMEQKQSIETIIAGLGLRDVLLAFLDKNDFSHGLGECYRHSSSYESFLKRFWRWFHIFRILKFVHFVREGGEKDRPVTELSREWLPVYNKSIPEEDIKKFEAVDLLRLYRASPSQ